MKFPKYPTVLLGFVWGPLRVESCGGADRYLNTRFRFLFFGRPKEKDGQTWAVTHLQKKSRFGFLVMWPFCFHVWFTFRFQKEGTTLNFHIPFAIPGTERVLYWRVGVARWDALNCRYYSPTWYGPGLHWD